MGKATNHELARQSLFSWGFLILFFAGLVPPLGGAEFIRGDANHDGSVTISDAHVISHYLYTTHEPSSCMSACDVNDDNNVTHDDILYLMNFLAERENAPPLPFPEPGSLPAGGCAAAVKTGRSCGSRSDRISGVANLLGLGGCPAPARACP